MAYYSRVGPLVADFAGEFIRHTKGRWAGQPLDFEQWQRDLLAELYLEDEDGGSVYREALLGVPRKNGKSTLAAAIALYGLVGSGEPGAEVYAAAASKDQARVVFDQARAFVEASPDLSAWLRPMRSAIVCEATGGVFRVLSSDAPKQMGLNPSLVVIDELHAHENAELYYALTTAQGARTNPLVVSITTAGFDPESICHRVYERGAELEAGGGLAAMREARFLFKWYGAEPDSELDDEATWRAANPSSWIDLADLREQRQRLPENVFRRLHLNQWTQAEEAWLPVGAWGECYEAGAAIEPGASVVLGVDLGTKTDTSAVVALAEREDGRIVVEAHVFAPKGDGTALEISTVEAAIDKLAAKFDVRACVYDKWAFEKSAQDLQDRGLFMVELPMSPERMAVASKSLYEAVVGQEVVHDGDKVLSAHVRAGATKEHERGWRLVKGKSRRPIDALIALALAYSEIEAVRSHGSAFEVFA